MQYAEAFKKLGYTIENQRQDWSAESDGGVCLALWAKQIEWKAKPPYMDVWELEPDGGEWMSKPGNKKRARHIGRAVDEFDGFIDAILVSGEPGGSYESATPWRAAERRDHVWRVTRFEPETGYFRIEAAKSQPQGAR